MDIPRFQFQPINVGNCSIMDKSMDALYCILCVCVFAALILGCIGNALKEARTKKIP